jgi:small multidrug resistance pump
MAHWLYLALAIVFEVFGTTMLKVAAGAPSWAPAAGVAVGYGAAFVCLGLALRVVPVGVAYAIWSGVGTALVALVGWAAFGQRLTLAGGAGIALIIAGVVVVQFNSTAH